jgi:hypothetical protein
LFNVEIDLLLSPIGGCNKAIQACELQEEAHQANATGTDFGTHQVYSEHPTMQEGKTRGTVKKGYDGGMFVKTFLIDPPCLKRAAGHVKRLGNLTQGEALGLQLAIPIKECSASGSIPTWVTIIVASLRILGDGCHSDLLISSFAFVLSWRRMARSPQHFKPSR